MSFFPWRRRLAYVGLGSNLDGPGAQVEQAIRQLDSIAWSRVVARSSLYRSAPLGPVPQADFINAAAMLSTRLSAGRLLVELKRIETAMGREPGERWGPRVIDLDLLVHGDDEIDAPGLTVPHPGIAVRNFVLLPLREIAPEMVVPGLGRLADIEVNESEPAISRVES